MEELRTHLTDQIEKVCILESKLSDLDKEKNVLTLELKQAREELDSKASMNQELDRRVREL